MKASFAYNKDTSPVSKLPASHVKTYDSAQYMARCQFSNVFWEYDRQHNYAPILVLEGHVDSLGAIGTKFPHDIDMVYFSDNAPHIRFDYKLNDEQYAKLASKGFYSDGVHLPEMFTTVKMDLEVDATVDEIIYENQNVPILEVKIEHPRENEFNVSAYELIEYITREPIDDNKALNNKTYQDYIPEASVAAEVEALKAAQAEAQALAAQAEYKPLTSEEMEIKRQSSNVSSYVDTARERLYGKRDEHNEAAAEEKARFEAEQAAKEGKTAEPERDKDLVAFDDTVVSKTDNGIDGLVEKDDSNKFDSNAEIFSANSDEADMPDNIKEFMQALGAEDENAADNTGTNKNSEDTGSGAASGAQGLGVYTFEDQDAAQHTMRQDEGAGNEKPKDGKSNDNKSGSDSDNRNGGGDTGSGAASGAQGLGVYTFEDKDTAQHAMRQDEGAGNEKTDDSKSDDNKQDDKPDNTTTADNNNGVDRVRREAQLQSTINDTAVVTESVSDERTK